MYGNILILCCYILHTCYISITSWNHSIDALGVNQQVIESYLCKAEKGFCGRQDWLIKTDSCSTLWGVIWNRLQVLLYCKTPFTSHWHEHEGVGFDRWTGRVKEIQRHNGKNWKKERDKELKREREKGLSFTSHCSWEACRRRRGLSSK